MDDTMQRGWHNICSILPCEEANKVVLAIKNKSCDWLWDDDSYCRRKKTFPWVTAPQFYPDGYVSNSAKVIKD